jgi:hypothetical protein
LGAGSAFGLAVEAFTESLAPVEEQPVAKALKQAKARISALVRGVT